MSLERAPANNGHRPIRSFHSRRGRVRPTATAALSRLWPSYGIDLAEGEPLSEVLPDGSPVALEVGCGMGEAAIDFARANPDVTLLAIDVHRPGLGVLLREVEKESLSNVRVASIDAVILLEDHVPDDYFQTIRIFFPDPWPKARHRKRRLLQPPFIGIVANKLAPAGQVHIATDWHEYADEILSAVNGCSGLVNPNGSFCPERPVDRTLTRFERKGLARGHRVFDIVATKAPDRVND